MVGCPGSGGHILEVFDDAEGEGAVAEEEAQFDVVIEGGCYGGR